MAVGIYVDVQIPSAISTGLRLRGVEVITAQEDGAARFADADLLTRATELRMLLYTHDDDFLKEARRRLESGESFSGVIYSHQTRSPAGRCIEDIEIIAKILDPDGLNGQIEYVPF